MMTKTKPSRGQGLPVSKVILVALATYVSLAFIGCSQSEDYSLPSPPPPTRLSLEIEGAINLTPEGDDLRISPIQLVGEGEKMLPKLQLHVGRSIKGHILIAEAKTGKVVHVEPITLEMKDIPEQGKKLAYKGTVNFSGYSVGTEYLGCAMVGGIRYNGTLSYGYSPFYLDETNKTLDIGAEGGHLNIPYATQWKTLSFNAKGESSIEDTFVPLGYLFRFQVKNTLGQSIYLRAFQPQSSSGFSASISTQTGKAIKGQHPAFQEQSYTSILPYFTPPKEVEAQGVSEVFALWFARTEGDAQQAPLQLTIAFSQYQSATRTYRVTLGPNGSTRFATLTLR